MPKTRLKAKTKAKKNDGPPSAQEWRKMKAYGAFKIQDEEGGWHEFRQGNDALVLPEGKDPASATTMADYEFWVVRIFEIKARSKTDVWVRVKWYWSAHGVAAVLPTFDNRHCSKYELLPSESEDYIPAMTFSAVITVQVFDETDIYQSEIGPSTFFARYKFSFSTRTIIRLGVDISLCLCGESYDPDEAVKRPSELTMHFCPHCVQAFHRECLLKHNFPLPPSQDELPFDSRAIDLMTVLPLEESEEEDNPGTPAPYTLSSIPPELVLLAQQPLVRPTLEHSITSNIMSVSNVAGNIAPVIKARKLIQQALNGHKVVPEAWRSEIGVEQGMQTLFVEQNCPHFTCPNCGGPI